MKNFIKLILDNRAEAKRPVNLTQSADSASIYVYDVISADWGVSALAVVSAIAQAGNAQTLNIHINSPGGDVFEGRAIMASIRAFRGKTVAHIDSLCASAATSIALACDEVVMSNGAFFMIHNAHGIAYGDKQDLRDTADTMEKVEGAIVADYTTKTGKDEATVRAWMDAETWFTSQEALDNGFIDSIASTDKAVANTWNLSAFANAPKLPDPPPPEPHNAKPADAGFFMSVANANRLRLLKVA